jgi:DNA adenine methylase
MGKPFLKWPGGKRWLAAKVAKDLRPNVTGRYIEPFAGGAAVFFALQPAAATLSDINADLINTYVQVRDRADELIATLKTLRVSKKKYYEIRDSKPRSPLARAVRFLYLNRTAFGGMYRLNASGEFNVPYGGGERTTACLWSGDLLTDAAAVLADVDLRVSDFEAVMDEATEGDVVYCDPTYTVAHENNGFIRYNERNFSWSDQQRLARACKRAAGRGAMVVVSNAYHSSIAKLYPGAARKKVERKSLVSREIAGRRIVHEYLLTLSPD